MRAQAWKQMMMVATPRNRHPFPHPLSSLFPSSCLFFPLQAFTHNSLILLNIAINTTSNSVPHSPPPRKRRYLPTPPIPFRGTQPIQSNSTSLFSTETPQLPRPNPLPSFCPYSWPTHFQPTFLTCRPRWLHQELPRLRQTIPLRSPSPTACAMTTPTSKPGISPSFRLTTSGFVSRRIISCQPGQYNERVVSLHSKLTALQPGFPRREYNQWRRGEDCPPHRQGL